MKKTLKIRIWKMTQQILQIFLNISSSQVRIKIHTENQPPSLFSFGDSYEEDFKIRIWKTTSQYFQSFLNISSSQVRMKKHTEKQSPSLCSSGDSYEEALKIRILKTTLMKMKIPFWQIFQFRSKLIAHKKSESQVAWKWVKARGSEEEKRKEEEL